MQNMQFQQETRASIQSLTNQMGQLATQLNQQQSQNSDKLPSQAVQNPKNVSAISLRSGKQCQGPQPVTPSSSANEPAKLHSTPEKVTTKIYLTISVQVNLLPQVILICRSSTFPLFHSLQEQFPTKKWKRQRKRSWKRLEK